MMTTLALQHSILATLPDRSKDGLWSVDLLRCESLILTSHWDLVVMDQFAFKLWFFVEMNRNSVIRDVKRKKTALNRLEL